jgi:hypothetical protein
MVDLKHFASDLDVHVLSTTDRIFHLVIVSWVQNIDLVCGKDDVQILVCADISAEIRIPVFEVAKLIDWHNHLGFFGE